MLLLSSSHQLLVSSCKSCIFPYPLSSPSHPLVILSAWPIYCQFFAYSLSMDCPFTAHSLHIHCLFTIHCLCTAFGPHPTLITAYSPPMHFLCTAHSLSIASCSCSQLSHSCILLRILYSSSTHPLAHPLSEYDAAQGWTCMGGCSESAGAIGRLRGWLWSLWFFVGLHTMVSLSACISNYCLRASGCCQSPRQCPFEMKR
jgi:hypothetical protein